MSDDLAYQPALGLGLGAVWLQRTIDWTLGYTWNYEDRLTSSTIIQYGWSCYPKGQTWSQILLGIFTSLPCNQSPIRDSLSWQLTASADSESCIWCPCLLTRCIMESPGRTGFGLGADFCRLPQDCKKCNKVCLSDSTEPSHSLSIQVSEIYDIHIENVSPKQFKDKYYTSWQPLVIRNASSAWPAVQVGFNYI